MEFRHNDAYGMRCQLTIGTGRTITLNEFDQKMTYAGLLEGRPNTALNDALIKQAMDAAQRHCVMGAKPHLIPPPRRDYWSTPGDWAKVRERRERFIAEFPELTPEAIPRVRCIGSFSDLGGVRDLEADLSFLTVVWFQDEYAPPILEPALSGLMALDWKSLAADGYM